MIDSVIWHSEGAVLQSDAECLCYSIDWKLISNYSNNQYNQLFIDTKIPLYHLLGKRLDVTLGLWKLRWASC